MKKILVFLFMSFFLSMNVHAASVCSYEEQLELNKLSSNIRIKYESVVNLIDRTDKETGASGYQEERYFNINILNLTEKFYIVVTNNYNNDKITFKYTDAKDGVITYKWSNVEEVTNFTFTVYSSDSTGCADESYKLLYLTTPRYNRHSAMSICDDNKDYYLCDEYVVFDKITESEFFSKIYSYLDEKEEDNPVEEEDKNEVLEFLWKYKFYIIGGIAIIAVTAFIIYRIKTKKQRELGL